MFKFHHQKGKLCNAGFNIVKVNPMGNITVCDQIRKNLGNVYEKIKFNEKIIRCPCEYCRCS